MSNPIKITTIGTLGIAVAAMVTFTACGGDGGDGESAAESSAGAPASVTTAVSPPTSGPAPTTAPTTAGAEPATTTSAEATEAFTPPGGAYSVEFPGGGEPEHQELEAPVPGIGTVPVAFYMTESGDRGFAVSRAEYPEVVADIAAALEGGRDSAIASVNGTLTGSERIELQGRQGMQFTADVASNGVEGSYISRIYVDEGKVLYQLIVTGPGDLEATDEDVEAFLESFTFQGE